MVADSILAYIWLERSSTAAISAKILLSSCVFSNYGFLRTRTCHLTVHQLTDWLAHTPKEVLAKNFGTTMEAFDNIPAQQLYIFPGSTCALPFWYAIVADAFPAPPSPDAVAPEDPQGEVPTPYTYKLSEISPTQLAGGTVRIADSSTFGVSTSIAVAEVTVQPGGMRCARLFPHLLEWPNSCFT